MDKDSQQNENARLDLLDRLVQKAASRDNPVDKDN